MVNVGGKHLTSKLLQRLYTTSQPHVYDAQVFAYCAARLRSYDYENYLWAVQLPKALRPAILALRAFNIEVALIPSSTQEAPLQLLRFEWWRDGLNSCYQGTPPEHPVLQALSQVMQTVHLTRYRLQQLVAMRSEDSEHPERVTRFKSMDDMERYADGTAGQLLYLQLEAANAFDQASHHTAMHLGKAIGMVRLLQGIPYHATLRRCYLPGLVCAAHGLSTESVIRGQSSEALKDTVLDVATIAKAHLDEARSRQDTVPASARPLLLSSVSAADYLQALEAHDFDVFSPALQTRAARPTLQYQLQLKWHLFRGTF